MKIRRIAGILVVAAVAVGVPVIAVQPVQAASCTTTSSVVVIPLTSAKHPNIIKHAQDAVAKGYPLTMVLYRDGAAARRKAASKAVATRPGYDRDEYPMAVGRRVNKADVRLVASGENRSAGAVAGNKLRSYCDGTRFRYAGVKSQPATTPTPKPTPTPATGTDPRFSTCAAAKKHGFGPYSRGSDPEYYWYQDRDQDGIVCE